LFNTCDTPATGYAGTAVFSSISPANFSEGWKSPTCRYLDKPGDPEGRVITADYGDFVVVGTYTPCTTTVAHNYDSQNTRRQRFNAAIREHLQLLQQEDTDRYVIWGGDHNVAPRDCDVYNPLASVDLPGFRDWERKDYKQLCSSLSLRDAYTHIYPDDTSNHFTWFRTPWHRSRNRGWRIDMAVVDARLLRDSNWQVYDACPLPRIYGSDHLPLLIRMYSRSRSRLLHEDSPKIDISTPAQEHVIVTQEPLSSTDSSTRLAERQGLAIATATGIDTSNLERELCVALDTMSNITLAVSDLAHSQRDATMDIKGCGGTAQSTSQGVLRLVLQDRCIALPCCVVPQDVLPRDVSVLLSKEHLSAARIDIQWHADYEGKDVPRLRTLSRANDPELTTMGAESEDEQEHSHISDTDLDPAILAKFEKALKIDTQASDASDPAARLKELWQFLDQDVDLLPKDLLAVAKEKLGAVLKDVMPLLSRPNLKDARVAKIVEASVPHISLQLGPLKVTTTCMADSGASYSVGTPATWMAVFGPDYTSRLVTDCWLPSFVLADNTTVLATGRIEVAMEFGDGSSTTHLFYVIDTHGLSCILGVDFFLKTGACIDFKNETIHLTLPSPTGKVTLPFLIEKKKTNRGALHPIFLKHDVLLPPKVSTIATACLQRKDTLSNFEVTGFVAPAHRGTKKSSALLSSLSKLRRKQGGVIALANASKEPAYLRKGTVVGYVSPVLVLPESTALPQDSPLAPEVIDLRKAQNDLPPSQRPPQEHAASEQTILKQTSSPGKPASPANLASHTARPPGPSFSYVTMRKTSHGDAPLFALDELPEPLWRDDPTASPATADEETEQIPDVLSGIPKGLHGELTRVRNKISYALWLSLVALFREFADIFAIKGGPLSTVKHHYMRLNIAPNATPVYRRPKRYNPEQRRIIIDYVTKLVREGVIEAVPVGTPLAWNSQLLMIPKADGTLRPTLDLRSVNGATLPMTTSLPRIQDCLDAMQGAHWITVMDISQCYFQMPLHPDDKQYTAFTTPIGKYWFTRAPMGAKDSQQYWLDISDRILGDLKWRSVAAYSDDLSCYTKSTDFADHIRHLRELFTVLRANNVALKPTKTQIARKEVSYVGYMVNKDGIRPDPKVREAVSKWNINDINSLTSMRRWIGFCNVWRRFIPHFASIIQPLREKLKKDKFTPEFTESQKQAFSTLNALLYKSPVLCHPDFDKPFEIHTDASKFAMGAALIQRDDNKTAHAVAYFSKSFTEAQKNYATHEQETFSLLTALELWKPYFYPARVKVVVDSDALRHLLKPDTKYSGRQLRWLLKLSTFTMNVEHRKGKKHIVPDMLSRHPTVSTYGNDIATAVSPLPQPTQQIRFLEESPADNPIATATTSSVQGGASKQDGGAADHAAALSLLNKIRARQLTTKRAHAYVKSMDDYLPMSYHARASTLLGCGSHHVFPHVCACAPESSSPAERSTLPSDKTELAVLQTGQKSALDDPNFVDITQPGIRALFQERQQGDNYCRRIKLRLAQVTTCACGRHHVLPCPHATFKVDPVTGLLMHHPNYKSKRARNKIFKPQVVIPESLLTSVLYHYHGAPMSGHRSYKRLLDMLLKKFWCKGLERTARRWCTACLVCAKRKPRRRWGSTPPGILVSRHPWDLIAIDTVGPFPTSADGYRWILTIIDTFTRYPIAVPLRSLHADNIARALFDHVFSQHGCPRLMLSDNAATLCGEVVSSLCTLFGIRQIRTQPYSPNLNGFVERWHGYLSAALTALTRRDKSDWDKWISVVLYAYRTTTHTVTGYSPFQAVFGRDPQTDIDLAFPDTSTKAQDLPGYVAELSSHLRDIHERIQSRTLVASRRSQARRLRAHKEVTFNVGDWVFADLPGRAEPLPKHIPKTKKLLDRWCGPYRLREVVGRGSSRKYRIHNTDSGRLEQYRAEQLSLYLPWLDDGTPSIPQRQYFSGEERRTVNAQEHKFVLPRINVHDLIVFPRTMPDGSDGYGVAKVSSILPDGSYVGQWYTNGDSATAESLDGPLKPCWTNGTTWYTGSKRRHNHQPAMTTDYPAPITTDIIADAAFVLTSGHRLPAQTLRRISEHRRFRWTLSDTDKATLGLQ